MPKQSYHHEDLKTELIEKGLLILNKEGFEGFSLRKVAQACGVSQTAPYRHFKDKDSLIAAISIKAISEFNMSLESAETFEGSPSEQLHEMGISYVHFFVRNPEYLKLLFFSNIQDYAGKDVCVDISRTAGDPFSTFQNAVRRYKESAPNETRSIEELTLYCWALVHGIAVLIVSGQMPCEGDCLEIADSVIRNINLENMR